MMNHSLGQTGVGDVSIIIPTLNEQESIGILLQSLQEVSAREVIVIDGGSVDRTVEFAHHFGARVIHEPRSGYGQACLTGAYAATGKVVVFMDGDGADNPAHINELLEAILDATADMTLGSRFLGEMEPGAMPWHQKMGNRLIAWLIGIRCGVVLTDLSPLRAVNRRMLIDLDMREMTFGWTAEMTIKAIHNGWRIKEIPVNHRPRLGGKSKISGTVRGTVLAAYHILSVILTFRQKGLITHD